MSPPQRPGCSNEQPLVERIFEVRGERAGAAQDAPEQPLLQRPAGADDRGPDLRLQGIVEELLPERVRQRLSDALILGIEVGAKPFPEPEAGIAGEILVSLVHAQALAEDGVAGRQVVEGDDRRDPGLDVDGRHADGIEDLPDDVEPLPVSRACGRRELPGAGFGESLHADDSDKTGKEGIARSMVIQRWHRCQHTNPETVRWERATWR